MDSKDIMQKLKGTFKKNCLSYKLLKQNEVIALYGIGGTDTDKILNYEVVMIRYEMISMVLEK